MSGQGPSILLRKTVLSLKSPTGAFIAPLRCANANLFNKVQEKLAKNKKAPARHKAEESYLLTTKLYCGKCGALMFGESGVSHTGKMYTYYKCAAAKKKKTCDKKAVRKQWLEDLVVNETMSREGVFACTATAHMGGCYCLFLAGGLASWLPVQCPAPSAEEGRRSPRKSFAAFPAGKRKPSSSGHCS